MGSPKPQDLFQFEHETVVATKKNQQPTRTSPDNLVWVCEEKGRIYI